MHALWEHVSCKTIIKKYFDRLAQAFQDDQTNISDAVQWDQSAGSSSYPIPSRSVTLLFLFASWNLIGKCVSIVACAFFSYLIKKFILNCAYKFG